MTECAAVYVRVSTEEQDLFGQESDLRQYSEGRGWSVVRIFREKVSATGKVERAEYDRLFDEARDPSRSWSHLAVWALDRFSRAERFTHAVEAIWELESLGICFHSFKEPGLDTPEDGRPDLGRDVLRALLPVIASFESKRRAERTRLAMREIGEGRRPTRSGRPVGRPVRVTPEKVSSIERLRSGGLTWKQIAGHVGLPAETCRRASWLLKRRQRAVGNSPTAIIGPTPANEVPR